MSQNKLSIITGKDNPILRAENGTVREITHETKRLISQMIGKMKELDGIGLAAPQVGQNIQFFIVDALAFDREKSKWKFEGINDPDVSHGYVFINPTIGTFPKPYDHMIEGCLSLPGWEGSVKRSKRITIKAQNEEGAHVKLQAKGLLARVLQHEFHHLQGTLIADIWENPKPMDETKRIRSIDRAGKMVFFGSPPYGDIPLRIIQKAGFKPIIVSHKDHASLNEDSYDFAILAAYGKILPTSVIKKFKKGILNIHPSLLPRYRGPSPVQQTILNGDSIAGVSIIKLNEKMDAGPLLAQKEFPLSKKYTTGELSNMLFTMGGLLLLDVLFAYLKGTLDVTSQQEEGASYTRFVKKEDALIDWAKPALSIEREIRAYQPWPVSYTFFTYRGGRRRVQILAAHVLHDALHHHRAGIIERKEGKLTIHCGEGTLEIKKLRPEGKKEMLGEEFLRGYAIEKFG